MHDAIAVYSYQVPPCLLVNCYCASVHTISLCKSDVFHDVTGLVCLTGLTGGTRSSLFMLGLPV